MIGALIGRQEGRNIEVMNSFELLSHTVDGHVLIDKEYYYTKEEQCKGQGGGPGLSRGVLGCPGRVLGVQTGLAQGVLEGPEAALGEGPMAFWAAPGQALDCI